MANLGTLEGISQARNELYARLEAGTVDDKRAASMERVLRGQVELKATIPLRMLSLVVGKARGSTAAERYAERLTKILITFTTGEEPEALTP